MNFLLVCVFLALPLVFLAAAVLISIALMPERAINAMPISKHLKEVWKEEQRKLAHPEEENAARATKLYGADSS